MRGNLIWFKGRRFARAVSTVAVAMLLMSSLANGQSIVNDEVSKQAALLETELGKYKESSPESAEALVKLVDLYHAGGRLFGLVRAGQQFTASHPNDPRHQSVMLKLIDGQEALSRDNDLASTIRQFLTRYPNAEEKNPLEVRLADAMRQLDDRMKSAAACRAIWNREGPNELGRRYGILALQLYDQANHQDAYLAEGELGEEMLDKLPNGEFAREVGSQAFYSYRRIGQWAKSTSVGNKIIQRGLEVDRESLRQLLVHIAENSVNLGQYANAAESYQQARTIRDDANLHYQRLLRLYQAGAKPAELEPLMREYGKAYPDRPDRLHGVSYLALSCIANADKARAVQLLSMILADDPLTNNNASVFVRENGDEPVQLADTEQKLQQAIAKNKPGIHYLRYVLAFDLYRDRVKDNAKAKVILRDLLQQSPSDDSYTSNAVDWLLHNSSDDGEFERDLALILAARKQYPHNAYLRNAPKNWAQASRQNKDLQARVALVNAELAKSDADPLISAFVEQRDSRHGGGESIRASLLEPATFDTLHVDAARYVLQTQADWFRYYAPGNRRSESIKVYRQFVAKFPQDRQVAWGWLESATDYGQPEDSKPAAENWLNFAPESAAADQWRRLLIAAERNNDPNLAHRAWDWMKQAQQKFGNDPQSASNIGDLLFKLGLEKEASEHWNTCRNTNRQFYESRECAARLLGTLTEPQQRVALIVDMFKQDSDFQGRYAQWLVDEFIKVADWVSVRRVIDETTKRQQERPLRSGDFDQSQICRWIDALQSSNELDSSIKTETLQSIANLGVQPAAAIADLALSDSKPIAATNHTARLLKLARATALVGNDWFDWDRVMPLAQSAMGKQDFISAVVLTTGMLAHISNVDENRKKAARDLATQSLSQMGGLGLTVDDSSPMAPLLQAAMYYRLGDETLAFEAYLANKELFRENRNQLPPDLLMFVCERLIVGGTDADHELVEEITRGWLVQFSENPQMDQSVKARMQLLLAKNFFKAQRFDVARAEYNTVINRYADTPQAIEAEFGIGETFLAQKVYDQAEQVFEKLSRSTDTDVVIRAEFLRGMLAFRRGDRDEARDIFQSVLERVPNVDLANQTLFNLAEVYGAEERYIDQLNLLRTVGRLGRASKRRHVPGSSLSIVVHDSDLGISRGHNRIPVRVNTLPGGDSETIYLVSSGAGKGLFRADLDTQLGQAVPNDHMLQVAGQDVIKCDYPDEFKSEFKNVPLSDVEISIAADGKFEVASSQIIDQKQETFSQELEREETEKSGDRRVSEVRPANQIKPGNPIYLKVDDGDRDLSHDIDHVLVKLTSDSGDQIQVSLPETGPHTGVFMAAGNTGELPAGALASDTGIDHSPLMAIDRDPQSFWISEPDGGTPKWLSVDMKDLREVTRVRVSVPETKKNSPVRADMLGSQDGELWFRLAGHPAAATATALPAEYGPMTSRVFSGDHTYYTTWDQVVGLTKNAKPEAETVVESLQWSRPENSENSEAAFAVMWQGKFLQPKPGAVRMLVQGNKTALLINGKLELPVGPGGRSVDLWLDAGLYDLAVFAASNKGQQPVNALMARASLTSQRVELRPFRATDFDASRVPVQDALNAVAQQPEITLLPAAAQLVKKTEQFGVTTQNASGALGYWQSLEDMANWEVDVPSAGPYEIWLELAHQGDGGRYEVNIGGKQLGGIVTNTGNWSNFIKQRVGAVLIESAGKQTLAIKPIEIIGGGLMDLKSVILAPAKGECVIQEATDWEFRFPERKLRYVKFVCHEYLGESLEIRNLEVSGPDVSHPYIPTQQDVLALATNEVLEIAGGDSVTATYTDELTLNDAVGSQLLSGRLQATYYNARVGAIGYDFGRSTNGQVYTNRKELKRVDPGERFVVEITDYDEDRTDQPDKVPFQVQINDQPPMDLEATETASNSGIFTKEIDTTDGAASTTLSVKPGDEVVIRFLDTHNTFPGHSVPREEIVYVPLPTAGQVRILETRVVQPPADSTQLPQVSILPKKQPLGTSGVAFEAPLTIEVLDPDSAKDTRSTALVSLATSDGAMVEIECQISSRYMDYSGQDAERVALEEGRFVGQVILQLGGKSSPTLVPVTAEMPRDLVGQVRRSDDEAKQSPSESMVTRVLNLTGRDVITATYQDQRRPQESPDTVNAQGRLISNGQLTVTDRDYEKAVTQLHVGERLYLRVSDPDADHSDARDFSTVGISSPRGEKETVKLEETLSHSGVFTGSLQLKAVEKPQPDNLNTTDAMLETFFGDLLSVKFIDLAASTETGSLEQILELPVVVGTDGLIAAFSKTFQDETLAVETRFRIAESYFELFKSHKQLEREQEKMVDIESGRRVLQEVMEDYPDPKYAPRIAYLMGQFSQELEQWDEAIRAYELILTQFSEHTLAPDAQYKLAQCYEQAGDFDQALEAYVTLAATHPKSPLIPNVMIRISDYFYKNEKYEVAAQVGEKFLERFESHSNAPRIAFRVGQCYHKALNYEAAGKSFDKFVDTFPKDDLTADAFFWAGESYRMANNNRQAFICYNNCRWKHPDSEAAKYARGRLALPEMLAQFESEANSVDEE